MLKHSFLHSVRKGANGVASAAPGGPSTTVGFAPSAPTTNGTGGTKAKPAPIVLNFDFGAQDVRVLDKQRAQQQQLSQQQQQPPQRQAQPPPQQQQPSRQQRPPQQPHSQPQQQHQGRPENNWQT